MHSANVLSLKLSFDGHRVRMVGTPEQPLWVAKDVCRALGLHNSRKALDDMVPAENKGVTICDTPGGAQQMAVINEAGLYQLITRSRKPSAQRFQAWLFGDVLPCIRKHGCYPAPDVPTLPSLAGLDLHDPRQLAAVALQALQLAAEYQPKAAICDALTMAKGDVGLQECGRMLHQPPNGFVSTMLEDGLLFRGPHGKPTPYQQWIAAGYFRVVMTEPGPDGQTFAQTKVTPLGMTWLAGRYTAQPTMPMLPRGQA